MKKHLAILFLAAGMLLGGAQQGQAVDFKAKGVWIICSSTAAGEISSKMTATAIT